MIDGLKAANAGPAEDRQRRADLARDHVGLPRARDADARRLPRPGRHLQRAGRARLLRLVDRARALRQHRRGVPRRPPPARPTSASCRSRTRPKAWSRARSTCSCTTPLFIIGETSLFVRHNLLRARRLARRHRGRLRASAGAGAVPRLAQPTTCPNVERRAGGEQCRRRAAGQPRPGLAGDRQRARGERVRPAHRRAGDPGRAAQPHPLRDRRPSADAIRSRRPRATTAPAWSCRSPNRPGAVHDMLVPLKVHGVSMTRFESRPARSGPVGVLLLHRPAGPSRPAARRRRAGGAARRVRFLQGAGHLSRRRRTERRPPPTMFEQLGVIGCGLMGGSFALALKRAGLVKRVVGYSKSPSTTEQAQPAGRHRHRRAESALLAVSGSDIVLIAVPVAATEATFKAIRHLVEPGMLIMDVGSTKRDVVDAARRVLKDRIGSFVPAHPIAGKEVVRHRACRRRALHRPAGDPDAARRRPRPSWCRRRPTCGPAIGCAGAADDAREPRRRLRRREPPAAHARLRLLQRASRAQPAGRDYLSLGGPGLSRLHAHRRQRPDGVARHPAGQPRRDAEADRSASAHTLDAMEHVIKTGNAEALEDLIRSATDARAGWQMNAATPHSASLSGRARTPRRMFTTALPRPPAAATAPPARCALPGSKSISNRVLLLAALARGHDARSHDLLDSDDTRVMLEALRALGCGVEARRRTRCAITGLGGRLADAAGATLFLGNAGTAMRPLTAALALAAIGRRASSCAACRACTSGRSATWSMRCAQLGCAHRLPRQRRAIRRCASSRRRALDARRADPRARRRVEPVPDRAADGAAAACADARRRRSRWTAS